jgi:hypothetical protein
MSEVKISTADIQKLREMTGAGMMDCKKALEESEGDFEGAIDGCAKKVSPKPPNAKTAKQKKAWLSPRYQCRPDPWHHRCPAMRNRLCGPQRQLYRNDPKNGRYRPGKLPGIPGSNCSTCRSKAA